MPEETIADIIKRQPTINPKVAEVLNRENAILDHFPVYEKIDNILPGTIVRDLRCSCGAKLAEYGDYEIRIMDRKCKTVTVLAVENGKLKWRMSYREVKGEAHDAQYQKTSEIKGG
jgi:hypothetical protein